MPGVEQGDTVKIHYTGILDNVVVFHTSVNGKPLQFTVGKHNIIAGFE